MKCDSELSMNTIQDKSLQVSQHHEPDIAVILVGRGSLYTQQPAEELSSLADELRFKHPTWLVTEALLEQGGPSLPQALESSRRAGAGTAVLLPVFMPVEAATRNWLRFVAQRWQRRFTAPLEILLGDLFNDSHDVADAAVQAVSRSLVSKTTLASDSGNAGTPDPDWSVIPPHAYHMLFCHGPRCTAAGAAELGAYLRKRLKDAGLDGGPGHVLAARTGCLYPCNLGPVMVVYPEGTWYCGLGEDAISRIVDCHFLNGKTVSANAFHPSPHRQLSPNSQTPPLESLGEE